ncbi:MAG: hypothetical protein J5646_00585 [Bacteroidales bacterium]|nr:hypothetical protein [Bacteroidales bacterium]
MSVQLKRFSAPLSIVFLLLGTACSMVKEYDVKIKELDTEVSLFGEGLSVPLGSTNKIILSSLLNSAGENIGDYLKKDDSGVLILSYQGTTSLADQIAQMDIDGMAKVDAIKINKEVEYHIGDLDPDKFVFDSKDYQVTVPFEGVDMKDMEVDAMNSNLDNLNFNAGLAKYHDKVAVNLAEKIGDLGHTEDITLKPELKALVEAAVASGIVGADDPYDVPDGYLDNKAVDKDLDVSVAEFKMDDNITSIKNIKLNSDAKMTISLEMDKPFISGGSIIPNVNLDLSKVFNMADGVINLSSLALNAANNWKASKDYAVNGLVKDSYESSISINEQISVDGTIQFDSPKTTLNTLKGDNPRIMTFRLSITFPGLSIASAEIAVSPVDFEEDQLVAIGNDTEYDVPDDVKEVLSVEMDPNQPLYLNINGYNLNRLKSKNFPYTISMKFPSAIEATSTAPNVTESDAEGKHILTFTGDLVNNASLPIKIVAFHPTVANKKVSLKTDIEVNAVITATNLVLDSANLPATDADDVRFAVTLDGDPKVSDVLVTTNDIVKDVSQEEKELEFEVKGVEGLGSFKVTPKGTPALEIACSMPNLTNMDLIPDGEGILMKLPDVFEFDASGLGSDLVFSAEDNSLLIKNTIPALISLPIRYLVVNPVQRTNDQNEEVPMVVTKYSVDGSVLIPSTNVRKSELDTIAGEEFGITVTIPKIEAKSVDLDDKFEFKLDQKYPLEFTLDTGEHLKHIQEVLLNEVYCSLDASFENLPDLGASDKFYVDLKLNLPDFIVPNEVPVKGYIENNKLTSKVKVDKLVNLDIPADGHLLFEDGIVITGSISANGDNVDLESLKSDIKAKFDATIASEDGKINLSKATGIFAYDIDKSTSIKLDNLPDMLKDESVTPDLSDPQITLDITTNLGVCLKGDIELVPVFGETPKEDAKIVISDVTLPFATNASEPVTKKLVILESATTAPPGYEPIEADVTSLLKKIPDALDVVIKANVDQDKASVVEIGVEYTCDINYAVTAPLSFGQDFKFSTSREIDLSSISQYASLGTFGIKGKAVNDSPLNLNVKLELLNADGAVIPQKKESVVAIAGGATATTSDIEFMLSPLDKNQKISKGRLTIMVTAVPGTPLKEDSSLQLTDLTAEVPEGIDYKL